MWCPTCQEDVAAEVSEQETGLVCTTCRTEVSSIRVPSLHPTTRAARQLLERWTTEGLLEQFNAPPETEPEADEVLSSLPPIEVPVLPTAKSLTPPIEASHESEPPAAAIETRSKAPRTAVRTRRPPVQHRVDAAHSSISSPHFSLDSALSESSPRRKAPGRMEALWGQLLAYGGVGLLTVGTVLVLWGYFGGPANYAPTGWLMATAGQMLLFLGVVTLISGGMEQTTHEVTQRIEHLGDQLIRIERQANQHALKGPHFPLSESLTPAEKTSERA